MTTKPHSALTLELCPFCGGEAEYLYRDVPLSKWRHRIVCASTTCGMEGPVESSKQAAIEAWNTRALTASAAERDEATWPHDAAFQLGELVQKKGRASWRGKIVGWYRTELTSLGFAVESIFEPGSVQIYPQTALVSLNTAARSLLDRLEGE